MKKFPERHSSPTKVGEPSFLMIYIRRVRRKGFTESSGSGLLLYDLRFACRYGLRCTARPMHKFTLRNLFSLSGISVCASVKRLFKMCRIVIQKQCGCESNKIRVCMGCLNTSDMLLCKNRNLFCEAITP